MTTEKWWEDNKYWEEGMDYRGYDSFDPKMDLIVAEAMRLGEAKAWDDMLSTFYKLLPSGANHLQFMRIEMHILNKLTEIKK